ncbi:hypothetical protein, partial [Methanobrevibacter sp.]|uniref:hypothetical protein n=1 Tax=Methanobrevibacter sp. TaxID=66852 RepID=UPI003863C230
MKFKKIMLVTFLLLAVLTIGAVSASDDAASDDLAVFDDGDSIDSLVDDVDLLSDPEDYDGGDDDDYDEYEVSVAEEFDVNDENATVVSLTCPDEAEGQFVVDVYIEGSEYYNPFHTVYHNIVPADYDKQISWTVKDLTITQSGSYSFAIYHLEEDDEKGDDTLIGDGEGDAVDYNAFRIVGDDDEKNCLDNSPVFALYCPDGHEGIVNVTVRNAQYEEQTFSKDIKDKDEYNFLYWTLEELNMTEIGEYQIAVTVNDGEFDKNWKVEVCSPVSITEDVSYIGSLIKRLDEFVVFMIPSDAEGNIVIEIDDVEIFNKNLDEFKQVDNEDYYWHYPTYGPDDVDTSFKYYAICSEAIPDVEEGDYEITARFTLGTTTYQESKTVTFKKSNIKTKDGVSIELLQEDEYEIGSNEYIALIAVPEEADGDIVVTSDGETLCNCAIYDLDDEDGIFVLSVNDLSINEDGSWAINVAYFEDGEKIVENEGNFFFVYDEDDEDDGDDDDAEDGVIIRVVDGDEDEFNLDDPEDLEKYFAHVSVSNDLVGNITIIVYGDNEEDSIVIFNKDISVIEDKNDDDDYEDFTCYNINFYDLDDFEVFKTHGSFEIRFMEFDEDDSGEYVELDSAVFIIDYDEGIVKFWSEDDDEDEDDEEDGVVIWVADGDESIFDLDEDLDEIFCIVSVENGLNGSIVINGLVYDEFEDEDIEIPLFDKDLSEIEDNEPDEELEGFTMYKIRLSDLTDLDGLKSQERIWVAFFETGEEDELDSREYSVEYNDDTNEIEFWEIDDDEDEGEPINAEFCDANVLTDDVVVYISKDDFPEDADDEFEVFIGEEEYPIRLKLTELDGDDEFYFIRVSDLFPEFEEMFESYGVGIFVQFYVDGDKAYYAAPEDDEEGVCIYYSPYIEGEAYLLNDDFVISFRGFEEVDDEFNVTISRPGIDDIVKTFKISELDNLDDEDGEFYELHLSDLGITETDEYDILVEFTKNGELLVYNNRALA